ncbi:MAG: translation initiation factor IF-1 [Clostridia bacterium]|nr:translation initiation factor IF-1 [Clostridia bacterium]
MSKEDVIETEGKVIEVLPKTEFRVQLGNGLIIKAYLGGKLRINNIRILEGDKVRIEMSPYDLTRGRIIYRNK